MPRTDPAPEQQRRFAQERLALVTTFCTVAARGVELAEIAARSDTREAAIEAVAERFAISASHATTVVDLRVSSLTRFERELFEKERNDLERWLREGVI
jgi:DNA gyrase/topoisomerase IV subunit A